MYVSGADTCIVVCVESCLGSSGADVCGSEVQNVSDVSIDVVYARSLGCSCGCGSSSGFGCVGFASAGNSTGFGTVKLDDSKLAVVWVKICRSGKVV